MFPLKVCSEKRMHKVAIAVKKDSPSLLEDVIKAAAKKLKIAGTKLVLEKDGTIIDEDIFILSWSTEMFMLLDEAQSWIPRAATTAEEHTDASKSQNLEELNTSTTTATDAIATACELSNDNTSNDAVTPTPSKKAKTTNVHELENMEISWEDFDNNTLQTLKNDCKGMDRKQKDVVIKQSVQYVVQQIRNCNEHAPISVFRYFAKEMCKAYPAVFEDKLATGERQGLGYSGLVNKLTERNRYLNRPHMTKSLSSKLKLPLQANKHSKAIQVGCTQWQPNFENEEQEQNSEINRARLLRFAEVDSVEFLTEMTTVFKNSFPAQRMFLNQKDTPIAGEIQNNWPCLFNEYYSQLHFLYLTGKVITELRSRFDDNCARILMFDNESAEDIHNENTNWQVLRIIFKHFKEETVNLFTIVKADASVNEIPVLHDYPHIVIFEEIIERNNDDEEEETKPSPIQKEYSVVVDDMCYPRVNNVIDALQLLMATYFNFNRVYPKSCACFLEFVQRLFLNIYPVDGNRSKSHNSSTKVTRFIQKLQKIEL